MLPDALRATVLVAKALEQLGITYVVCGSLASSAHGMVRTTMDTDMVADVRLDNVNALVDLLQEEFYIDAEMIRSAIEHRSSFNVIHLETMFKVDIFIPKQRPFDQNQLARRQETLLGEDQVRFYILTPEDIILAKLEWFRLGGEESERQWRDILGVLIIQQGRLDMTYLQQNAAQLGVADLLKKAMLEATAGE